MTVFEAAKTISALDVAERYAGVRTTVKGRRAWCSCPFHADTTPSMSFDIEGRYAGQYICSSGKHDPDTRNGSSVNFVAAWFKESAYDAARRICDDYNLAFDKMDRETAAKAAKARQQKAEIERLTAEIAEAAAFAVAVACGVIAWCEDRKAETEDPTEINAYNEIIKDATEFREAVSTPDEPNVKHAILTRDGVKEKLEGQYRLLKRTDDETGTQYISWYKRGEL